MAHEVFGERFAGRRTPAWHHLGTVFAEELQLTVREAYELVHIDYTFAKCETYTQLPDGTRALAPTRALYRSPTFDDNAWKFIGNVESDYGVIQPLELADLLDAEMSKRYPVETAGALHDGATNFASLKLNSYDIRGEEMGQYFLIANSNGINRSLRIMVTDIRVVCANTLNAAIDSAQLQVCIPHTANLNRDMLTYLKVVHSAEAVAQKQRDLFRIMAATPIARNGLLSMVAAAWPDPKQPQRARVLGQALQHQGLGEAEQKLLVTESKAWQSARERNAQYRDAATSIFDNWGDYERGGKATVGTVWAAVNAVAEVSDNRIGNSLESAAAATMFGDRYLERARAMTVATKLVEEFAGVN